MGYTFKIGNAVSEFDKSNFPHLSAEWDVMSVTHPDAPTFPNDEMTGNSSERSPSYSTWAEFCRETGIFSLFYDERGHLHGGHPGCIGITPEMAAEVAQALERRRAKASLPPGFEGWDYQGPARYDYNLARLIWLDWWMRWAIENCETPAIANY
jgi:hypothetical protein